MVTAVPEVLAVARREPVRDDRERLTPGGGWAPFGREALEHGIPKRFAAQVRAHGQRPAVRSAAQSWSYSRVAGRANRIAHAILERRGDREEPIALLLRQGPELVAAILGALAAGKVYVPLDPAHPETRSERVLSDCQPPLLIATCRELATARRWPAEDRLLDLDRVGPDLPSDDPALDLAPDRLAYLFYTSGSTGRPKGVVDCHRNVLHNILRYTDSLRIGCEDRLTLVQSCAFSGSVSSLFAALLNGACCHPIDLGAEGIQGLARRTATERITMFHGVPAIFRQLAATDADLSSLRVIRLEGDLASRRDAEVFQRRFKGGCTLVNGLGATETGLTCQYFVAPDTPLAAGGLPVGYPTVEVAIAIVGNGGEPVGSGEIGEIVVRSPYLAVGYWNDPARTADRFRPDPREGRHYHSGDLGRWRADGAVELLGRKDLQVKLNGGWVDLPAVENALLRLDEVHEAAVVVRDSPSGRPELVAYVVPAASPPPRPAELRAALLAGDPELPVPGRWHLLDALPRDANEKIDRAKLPDVAAPDPTPASVPSNAPDIVLACWREVLGPEAIATYQPFAEAGGDPFAALELALLLEQRLKVRVPPDLIAAGTTAAQLVERLADEPGTGCVALLAGGGSGPPLFLFHGAQGHLVGYHALARRLGASRPVYGVRFPALDAAKAPPISVAGLAALYAAEIRRVAGEGPCTLAGNCMGGLFALETARRLHPAGVEMAPPVLIDTAFPTGLVRRLPRHAMALLRGRSSECPTREELPPTRVGLGLSMAGWIGRKLRRRGIIWGWRACRAAGVAPPGRLMDASAVLGVAGTRYRPRPQDDRAVLVCIGRVTNHRGWESITRAGLETVLLPAQAGAPRTDHAIEVPYVDGLAELLRDR
jgi:amino acid adenylation domain-containing protein